MFKKILITGGAGFIGSNFIRYMLGQYKYRLINLDLLTYAGNLDNLAGLEQHSKYSFIRGDIVDRQQVEEILAGGVEAVVNFAAESHVDRSIEDATEFIRTNVQGTQVLLDLARKYGVRKFVQVSTDEVYGSLGPTGYFTEDTPLAPNSPYSASKASADLLARAYYHTYGLPVVITRCSNNYGPYQFPEKLIPLMVTNALEDQPLPVYGDGQNVRDWLHVQDHCAAIDLVLHQGIAGEVYNIGGNNEHPNLEIGQGILNALAKPQTLIKYVKDRPGHDRLYAIDAAKISRELGWRPQYTFDVGLAATVEWYRQNRTWWAKVKSGEYRNYYERMYGNRG